MNDGLLKILVIFIAIFYFLNLRISSQKLSKRFNEFNEENTLVRYLNNIGEKCAYYMRKTKHFQSIKLVEITLL